MADTTSSMTLDQLDRELFTATERLRAAQQKVAEANREECAACNAVNDAQKRMDAALKLLRGQAPRGTDWHSRANPGTPV